MRIVRGIGWRHVLPAVPVLFAVIVAASLLVLVPGLDFGWWSAIGGVGNPVTGVTENNADTWVAVVMPLVILALLVPALPLFAAREERWFRLGAEDRSFWQRRRRDIEFGLIHALVGIPIGVALALSIGGSYFTWSYLRGARRGGRLAGLLESTRAHVAYNAVIIAIALAALVADAFLVSG